MLSGSDSTAARRRHSRRDGSQTTQGLLRCDGQQDLQACYALRRECAPVVMPMRLRMLVLRLRAGKVWIGAWLAGLRARMWCGLGSMMGIRNGSEVK
jgi:hypothetical protein